MLCIRIVEKYKCSVIRRALFRVYTDAVREKQQALQLQREAYKSARSEAGRAWREERKQRRFELRQQKRREKHRGR